MSFARIKVRVWVACLYAVVVCGGVNAIAGSAEELAALNQQFVATFQKGHHAEALTLATTALRMSEETFGLENKITIEWLNAVGALCGTTRDYQRAVTIYARADKAREKVFGPESREVLVNLYNLADAHETLGHLAEAESVYRKMVRICDKGFGPNSRYAALGALRLANFFASSGRYPEAEPLFQRSLGIFEKTAGPEHLDTVSVMNGLAEAYRNMGDYAKAELLYRRALNIAEKNPSAGPQTVPLLTGLGALYMNTGDYSKAESFMQRALKSADQWFGPEQRETAACLNNLAALYCTMGAFRKAEPFSERALKLTEKLLGPDRTETANARQNLAGIYMQTQRSAEAESLFRQVLEANERLSGPAHPATAAGVESLAILSHERRNFTNAENLYRRAIEADERALGRSHRQTLTACVNLCCLLQDMRRHEEALALAGKIADGQAEEFANILSFAAEKQRLAYRETYEPYSMVATLEAAPQVTLAILRNKCVVLDSLLEDRRVAESSTNAENRALIEQIGNAKQQLNRLSSFGPASTGKSTPQTGRDAHRKLTDEIEQLEGSLARHVTGLGNARQALRVTVDEVRNAIPTNAALVECVRYRHYQGFRKSEYRYGAAIVTRCGEPKWVCLGSADAIERAVRLYQDFVRNEIEDPDDSLLRRALRGLYQQLWAPIESSLPAGTKTIIMSPDDRLNFISYATLLATNDQFLAEKYSLRYVTSGRDLLRTIKTPESADMVIFAAPDYATKGAAKPETSGLYLEPLPELATNAAGLEARAKKWNWPVRVYLGADAAEKQLHAIRAPRILHLSTHGFFLPVVIGSVERTPYSPIANAASGVVLVNPMRRSGVALARAQDTLDAWAHGQVPPASDDGILTAEEVGGMNLDGTWLVTLAACDTGTGTSVASEGVMGLRRGFIQAGAQNLLMTLWPVAVDETDDFLLDFYSAVHKSGCAPEALANVQRDWLVRTRARKGLFAAVFFAGPFVLNAQGPVQ
jgi:CHAT domain-containing protein/Tfp pilus assembly protein PilF